MSIQLRPAQLSDLEAILALERATENAPHWPESAYSAIVGEVDTSRCLIVACAGESLVGFAVGLIQPGNAEFGELESVVVTATQRREGIGRALCTAVVDWCRSRGAQQIVLEVRAASDGAITLYRGLGFLETGRRPRYYREPLDDAILMRLS